MDIDELRQHYLEKAPYPFDGTISDGSCLHLVDVIAGRIYAFAPLGYGIECAAGETLRRQHTTENLTICRSLRWPDELLAHPIDQFFSWFTSSTGKSWSVVCQRGNSRWENTVSNSQS